MNVSLLDLIGLIVIGLAFIFLYVWPVAWAIRDANERGSSGGIIVLFFWLCGPLVALIWLLVRPPQNLTEKYAADYESPDDALDAAARLDCIGEWDAAERVYLNCIERWPEHARYARSCIDHIGEKRKLT